MIPVTIFAGRTVAVFGLARSGIAAAQALVAGGATVVAWDDGGAARERAGQQGLSLADLNSADWSRFAALVLSPGVPLTHPRPHWTVERAAAAGIEVIGDTELFFRELAAYRNGNPQRQGRPAVIGITGTNGKSTTTALTAHVLATAGLRVQMGGNIGRGVLDLEPFDAADVYVLELSSYQVDLSPALTADVHQGHCDVGVLLNLTPDHLDRHGSMQHYAEVKERLVVGARHAVVGIDDPYCRAIAQRRLASGGLVDGVHLIVDLSRPRGRASIEWIANFERAGGRTTAAHGDDFVKGPVTLGLRLENCRTLRGAHNAQNAAAASMAAVLVARNMVPELHQLVQYALESFPGLAHRMELLGTLCPLDQLGRPQPENGIPVVNDSKATNADSTAKALNSWGNALHWIVGGRPKDGGIDSLEPFLEHVAHVYLIGESSDAFAAFLAGKIGSQGVPLAIHRCGTLSAARSRVFEVVERQRQEPFGGNGAILFSPACASFDQFKDFEDRGNQFRKLVEELPGFLPYGQERSS